MPPTLQVIITRWSGLLFAAMLLGLTAALARRQQRSHRSDRALGVLALGFSLIAGTRSAIGLLVHTVLAAFFGSNLRVIAAPLGWIAALAWACWAGALGLASRDEYRALRARRRPPPRVASLAGLLALGGVMVALPRVDDWMYERGWQEQEDMFWGVSRARFRSQSTPLPVEGLHAAAIRQVELTDGNGGVVLGHAVDRRGSLLRWSPERPGGPIEQRATPFPISAVTVWGSDLCGLDTAGHFSCWSSSDNVEEQASARRRLEDWTAEIRLSTGGLSMEASTIECAGGPRLCVVLSSGRTECHGQSREGKGLGVDVRALTVRFGCVGCVAHLLGGVECWSSRRDSSPGDVSGVVRGVSDVVRLASVRERACAIQGNGRLFCWALRGAESGTELSLDATEYLVGKHVEQVAVGVGHSCAILNTGALFCWGSNAWGQLGDNSTEDRSTPVAVQGITDAVQVAVAASTTCLVHASGRISCWGRETRW